MFFHPLFAGGFLLFAILGLAGLAFTIWMLVDAVRRPEADFEPPNARIWWIIGLAVGLVLGWVGIAVSVVYYIAVRKPLQEGRRPTALFGTGGTSAGGGVRLDRSCRTCGHPLGTHSRYCQNCGTPVGEDR